PVSCVSIDNFNASVDAVNYLIKLGHSKIAAITGDFKTQVAIDRLNGYLTALEKHKIEKKKDYIKYGDFERESARILTKELIRMKMPPTAIFAASDEMAVEAIRVCLENGVSVPGDISIIGFDDNPLALNYSLIPLTTIRQPLHKMAVMAAKTLNDIIQKKIRANKRIVLPTELVERGSCRALD
ncbi:MAG: substrate-binding domain-containing protein, partial [Candidatus Omnitrophota bacterium]